MLKLREIRLFRDLSECSVNRKIIIVSMVHKGNHICLYRFSFIYVMNPTLWGEVLMRQRQIIKIVLYKFKIGTAICVI